jgi:hypothetical protein
MLFDGEGFILQRQWLFTRIHSGAVHGGKRGGTRGSTVYGEVAVCTNSGLLARSASSDCECGG